MNVLHVCHYWGLEEPMQKAVDKISSHLKHLNPAARFYLGKRYNVHSWQVNGICHMLLKDSFLSLTPGQFKMIGEWALFTIQKGQELITELRSVMAACPPELLHSFYACEDHNWCQKGWNRSWVLEIGVAIHHPLCPLDIDRVLDVVESVCFPDTTPECHDWALDKLRQKEKDGKGYSQRLSNLVEEVTERIVKGVGLKDEWKRAEMYTEKQKYLKDAVLNFPDIPAEEKDNAGHGSDGKSELDKDGIVVDSESV